MSDDFEIFAEPEQRCVSPGAVIQYHLFGKLGGTPESEITAQWFAFNDPKSVSGDRHLVVRGPSGLSWPDAKWSFPGQHRIVCRVTHQGKTTDVTYHQWVVPLASFLAQGPQLPRLTEDPSATLDGVSRFVDVIQAVAKQVPPQDEEAKEKHEDTLAQMEAFRDKLRERLESTKGLVHHPMQAEHFDAKTQKNLQLRTFLAKVAFKRWIIVDWTSPEVRAATGEYVGVGATDQEAIENAIEDWNDDNRYPDGGIVFVIPQIRDVPELKGSFETDGTAQWDSIASFFGWVGFGAAVVAGVITLLAPVPGSQIASAAIWTSIFSSTAAAVINIGTRVDEGFSSFRANAFDVLTIVGNLFGVAGLVWSRGATVLVQTEKGIVKAALIGSFGTDAVQGVLLGEEFIGEFNKIQSDPSIPPAERTQRLVQLFRQAAINGVLLYVSVKATKTDLDNLNVRGTEVGATTPAERLKELADPKANVDLTKPVKVQGSTNDQSQTTKVNPDQEIDVPHTGGRSKTVRVRTEDEAFKDIIGHKHHADILADLPQLRATRPELSNLTDSEVVALRGYTLDVAKPEFAGLKDFQRINNALRFNDTQQLALLAPYIKFLRSGLAKLPKFEGTVFRVIAGGVDPADIRKQFVQGETWHDLGFLSTSHGKPLDQAQVTFSFSDTKAGHRVESVAKFPEREVLFPPGVRFRVLKVIEHIPGRFLIMLKQE